MIHSPFGASVAARWTSCPGSVALCKKAPPQPESPYATEGQLAHKCLEAAILGTAMPPAPEEMYGHARWAADLIHKEARGRPIESELRVVMPFGMGEVFGTLDAAVVAEGGVLRIYDFKYGIGILVAAEANLQLLFYACALASQYEYNFESAQLVVLQPRVDETVSRWIVSVDELKSKMKWFHSCYEAIKLGVANLVSGPHCRWCQAKPICPAIADAGAGLEVAAMPIPVVPEDALVGAQDLARALKVCDRIELWVSAVRGLAYDQLMAGHKIPGFKLAEKRAVRKWTREAEAAARDRFGDLAFKVEMLSPAQLEKQLKDGKGFAAKYAVSKSSGLNVVEDSTHD